MLTVSLDEARRALAELIHQLPPGEVVMITEHDRHVSHCYLPTRPFD